MERPQLPISEPFPVEAGVDVFCAPHPFAVERISAVFPAGQTVAEILAAVQPDAFLRRHSYVFLNDHVLPPDVWARVRPKAGTRLTIRMAPSGGGGGKNPLRTILSLAILVAAPMAGAAFAGAIAATGAGAIAATTVGTSVINFAGRMLLNSLIPPARSSAFRNPTRGESPTLFIQGARNQLLPFGRIPRVLGRHRMTPPMGARPFTETVGDAQYVRMLFVWGYGPLEISDLKIGETALSEFEDVEIETRKGYPEDAPLSLYSQSVDQNDLSVALTQAGGYQTRTTREETDEISVDVTFPRGLAEFDARGRKKLRNVQIEIQYAPTGTADYSSGATAFKAVSSQSLTIQRPEPRVVQGLTIHRVRTDRIVLDPASGAARVIAGEVVDVGQAPSAPLIPDDYLRIARVTRRSDDAGVLLSSHVVDERRDDYFSARFQALGNFLATASAMADTVDLASGGLKFPGFSIRGKKTEALRRSLRLRVPRGKYDVRLRRLTSDSASDEVFDETYWTALRSIRHESPVHMPGLAMTALRIKATDQLNGVVDQFNGVVSSIVSDWDGSDWVDQPTSNPAALFRHVLQGSANARPLGDERIDLAGLQEWHAENAETGRRFDAVIDFDVSVREVLDMVAAAGRASPTIVDGKWSVVQDRPQNVPVQHFTPRNSFSFRGEKSFAGRPEALRARFINEEKGWQQDERLVFADGVDENTAQTYEGLDLPGITDPDQAWRAGRYHLAAARLRPETYSFVADVEHIVCTRGDLIYFSHDVPLFGLMSARVKSIEDDGGAPALALSVTLDSEVEMQVDKSYALRFRKSNGSSFVQAVVASAGITRTLTFQTPFAVTDAPAAGDLAMFGQSGQESVALIVKSIEPQGDLSARITCVDAAPGIFTAADQAIPAFSSQITVPSDLERPAAPVVTQVQSGEEVLIRNADGSFTSRIVLSLRPPPEGALLKISVLIRGKDETEFTPAQLTSTDSHQLSIIGVEAGEIYDIALRYQTISGVLSAETRVTHHQVTGASGLPSDVSGFTIHILGSLAHLSWDPVADIDLSHYRIKFSPRTSGATWGSSVDLVARVARPASSVSVPVLLGTYLIKAVDAAGQESASESQIVSTIAAVENLNIIDTISQAPDFPGTRVNLGISESKLRLTGNDSIDDWPNIDVVANMDVGLEGLQSEGMYVFPVYYDLGAVYTSVLTADIEAAGVSINNTMESYVDVDAVESWDGAIDPSKWTAELQLRTTDDDPAGAPIYSAWRKFVTGQYTARAFEWRLLLSAQEAGVTPAVSKLDVVVDMPDRVEAREDVLSLAAGSTVTFDHPFRQPPAVAISAQDMQTGDYFEITNKTAAGFDVRFFNSSGAGLVRSFDYIAKGFGLSI